MKLLETKRPSPDARAERVLQKLITVTLITLAASLICVGVVFYG